MLDLVSFAGDALCVILPMIVMLTCILSEKTYTIAPEIDYASQLCDRDEDCAWENMRILNMLLQQAIVPATAFVAREPDDLQIDIEIDFSNWDACVRMAPVVMVS